MQEEDQAQEETITAETNKEQDAIPIPRETIPQWQNPKDPRQSPLLTEAEIPKEAIKIVMTAQGFTPKSFTVNKGQEVVLSVSSGDEWTHVFKFQDESLSSVALGLGSDQTRVITFYAPSSKGEYEYYCDVPGHKQRGETGIMIVK